ncbi:MAG: hypothetical protein LAT84_03015 [Balneolia bacterium]|nr:hypothetical protein [Balneolia bacterium]
MKISVVLVVVLVTFSLMRLCTAQTFTDYGPGPVAPNEPVQTNIQNGAPFELNGYTITPLATFESESRVLSAREYNRGREADLSPIDLALGWGEMSDQQVLRQISIRQMNRFYFWNVEQFPIPRRNIETQSANMHMIPANRDIERKMKLARRGDVVRFSGSLVRADAPDGWRWVSSLTRDDTGNGACELVYVEEFEFVRP